ncbi:MAG TPA: transcription antitermination factor NusB [Methylibium sp.]|uniref:transcription antitermination factor NusB n=1 Tax=Methylibium sp. TaxID=2067992 RepID=UPI002DBB3BDE|nr:transcription antitermination factor NusB [Methylibium sp.]HEU4457533.1 transcription antitermination factor NusB [Methylibium sp.]
MSEAPPAQPDGAAAQKKGPTRSARRRARELALQGLYQWLLTGESTAGIAAHVREQDGYARADSEHLEALLYGCIEEAKALDAQLGRHVDRKTSELSPIEHGVLMIGAYELAHCIEIPYRVVINEAVELAKSYGGTDGHKYVNGVLDKVAGELRAIEVQARRAAAG